MRRSTVVSIVIALTVLTGEAGWAQPTKTAPWLITPGHGIGHINIWMTRDDVTSALGDPTEASEYWWIYSREGLVIKYPIDWNSERPLLLLELDAKRATTSTARTSSGIGLGSRREAVVLAFGEPEDRYVTTDGGERLSYRTAGIWFYLEDGEVVRLEVMHRDSRKPNGPAA